MLSVLYELMYYFGYFLVMIVIMAVAIALAKGRFVWVSWLLYVVGAVLQLLSLIGNQATASLYGTNMVMLWVVYVVLLIIAAVWIAKRRSKWVYEYYANIHSGIDSDQNNE